MKSIDLFVDDLNSNFITLSETLDSNVNSEAKTDVIGIIVD